MLFFIFYNVNKKTNALIQKYEKEKEELIGLYKQQIEKKDKYIKKLSAIGKETAKEVLKKVSFFITFPTN